MNRKQDWPYWTDQYKSRRHFQAKKRRQLTQALKILDECRLGCAYMPEYKKFTSALDMLEEVREAMRVRAWKQETDKAGGGK